LLPELSELFNGFPTFAVLAGLRSFFDGNLMRLEDEVKDGVYEIRAELPGVDPTYDIEVTVRDGQLTIKVERTQTSESNGHSEFTYGSFVRTVALPAGAKRG
jgi:HSP20 family molecular chaperone IbpA